MVVAICY